MRGYFQHADEEPLSFEIACRQRLEVLVRQPAVRIDVGGNPRHIHLAVRLLLQKLTSGVRQMTVNGREELQHLPGVVMIFRGGWDRPSPARGPGAELGHPLEATNLVISIIRYRYPTHSPVHRLSARIGRFCVQSPVAVHSHGYLLIEEAITGAKGSGRLITAQEFIQAVYVL